MWLPKERPPPSEVLLIACDEAATWWMLMLMLIAREADGMLMLILVMIAWLCRSDHVERCWLLIAGKRSNVHNLDADANAECMQPFVYKNNLRRKKYILEGMLVLRGLSAWCWCWCLSEHGDVDADHGACCRGCWCWSRVDVDADPDADARFQLIHTLVDLEARSCNLVNADDDDDEQSRR